MSALVIDGKTFTSLTYEQAEWQHRNGYMTDSQWTQYQCAWRNGAPRFSNAASQHDGHNPKECPHA